MRNLWYESERAETNHLLERSGAVTDQGQVGGRCFICGESTEGCTTRQITALGTLRVEACAPCVDLPDTPEFVNRLIVERLMPQEA